MFVATHYYLVGVAVEEVCEGYIYTGPPSMGRGDETCCHIDHRGGFCIPDADVRLVVMLTYVLPYVSR